MRLYKRFLVGIILVSVSGLPAQILETVQGEVRIRKGMEETWQDAVAGRALDPMDTICCLEGTAGVRLTDGSLFTLGANSILNVHDLKRISRQQLFLYLTSLKVDQLVRPDSSIRLKLGNVSVVHGEKRRKRDDSLSIERRDQRLRFVNGARALRQHGYLTNALATCYRILTHYPTIKDCGELYLLVGQWFEQLEESGRALDAYQQVTVLADSCASEQGEGYAREARASIERLSNEEK